MIRGALRLGVMVLSVLCSECGLLDAGTLGKEGKQQQQPSNNDKQHAVPRVFARFEAASKGSNRPHTL